LNQREVPISQIYFWNRTLHVSDSISVHRQESSTVHCTDDGWRYCPKHVESYSKICVLMFCSCCIHCRPGEEHILDIVPGGTELGTQVKTGSWAGRTHTLSNPQGKCTGVLLCVIRE